MRVLLEGAAEKVDAIFHHIDGSYSYCTLGDDATRIPYNDTVFHIRAWTEMKMVDGRWEFDQSE